MGKKSLFLFLGLALCLGPTLQAVNIIYISENDDQNADGIVDDLRWPEWLTEQGFIVSVQRNNWLTLDAAKIAALNQADLVIVSRNTDSGDYANSGEAAQWNSVTAPMLMMTPYLSRGSRWNWVGTETLTIVAGTPIWDAVVTEHPVFFGVSLSATPQVSALESSAAQVSTGTAHMGAAVDAGNGVVIAQVAGTGEKAIVEWLPGKEFRSGGPMVVGRRLLFCVGTTESATTPQGAFNLTVVGGQMFLNAVKYMLGMNFNIAGSPNPSNGASDVQSDATLAWTPGPKAAKHDVYIGTSQDTVRTASRANPSGVLASQGQDANTYDPAGSLEFGQTYYWRIDEIQADGVTIDVGDVWSLTAEPYGYPVMPVAATASSSRDTTTGPEKTIDGSGLDATDQHSINPVDMWLTSKTGPQPIWIQYDFDRVYKLHEMWVWNQNQLIELDNGYGAKDVLIEVSTDGATWTTLAGVPEFAQATGEETCVHNTTVNFGGVLAKFVRLNINSNWGENPNAGLSEVRFFYVPVEAFGPSPASGTMGVAIEGVLHWRPGRTAASHEVYLGIDPNALSKVNTGIEHQYNLGSAGVEYDRTYYWKVNEVNEAETPKTWEGDVWSFSTPRYVVVDDFESYNDLCKRIYYTWVDGAGHNGSVECGVTPAAGTNSGSTVGNPQLPYAEQTNVHGGRQAMPLWYDNTVNASSEAVRTFDVAQDWTRGGTKTLVLFFSGNLGNAAGQLYVKINGSKVVYGGDAGALVKPWWTQWNIDLASSGANVKAVMTLAVGVSGGSGKGTLYVDDIRLYRSAPAQATEEIWIEAESGSALPLAWDMLADKADASGGKYVGVKAGNNSMAAPPLDGVVTYSFNVKGGTYKLFARSIVPTADDNSLWLRINGATVQTAINASGWVWWYDIAVGGTWHWDAVRSHDDGDKAVLFTMPGGTYTLDVAYREDGLLLDAFLLTNKLD